MDSKIEDLLENARNEIKKLNQNKIAEAALNQSVMFADNVLKRLIALTINKNVNNIFEHHLSSKGSVLMTVTNNDTNTESKYTMELDIVPSDYMLDLGELRDNPEVKERIVFLLNTVKVLFCPIKDYMKRWVKTNQNSPIISSNGASEYSINPEPDQSDSDCNFNYVLQIGLNTTLFIDKDTKERIGIILKKVDEFPQ